MQSLSGADQNEAIIQGLEDSLQDTTLTHTIEGKIT